MRKQISWSSIAISALIGYVFVLWAAVLAAPVLIQGGNIFEMAIRFMPLLEAPFSLTWQVNTPKTILIATGLYLFAIFAMHVSQRNTRFGEEHGSASWGDVKSLCRKYRDRKNKMNNRLFTSNFRMGMDMYRTQRNLHTLVVGGPGTQKSRGYVTPNILQCNSSYIVTDPKGELLKATGWLLTQMGYEIRVFDLAHPTKSKCYNPFFYIRHDMDVLTLTTNLINNTEVKGAQVNDPFWKNSEQGLLSALIFYLLEEAPLHEQNFAMVLTMLRFMEKSQEEGMPSPVEVLFEELSYKNPDSIAVKQFAVYRSAPEKVKSQIVNCTATRLNKLNVKEYSRITSSDNMDLGSIGEKKVALFSCTPVNDTTMNFLIGMMYTQAYQILMNETAEKYGGRLPIPVHCLMDEFANIAIPENFERILATTRSYEISFSIVIQSITQLKTKFKDEWESILSDCDELLYLGGNEPSTFKFLSETLDKETLDTNSYGRTRGRNGSYSTNYQNAGRDLMTPGEVRMVDNEHALLLIRGERPVFDLKYDLKKHPNIKFSSHGEGKEFHYEVDLPTPRYTRPEDCSVLSGEEAASLLSA